MLENWLKAFKEAGLWLEGSAFGSMRELTSDSRVVLSSQDPSQIVFFARRGVLRDGHDFLNQLSTIPVAAFVVERIPSDFKTQSPIILVRDSRLAMAIAAKNLFQDPTSKAFTVAVTGTNGKTTSTFLIQSLLKQRGLRPARNGTIETQFEDFRQSSNLTTPDFSEMQRLFADLRSRGANAFVFEASSHALDQRRLLGLELDAGIFTNLTPEHLDYHQNMETYFQSKRLLFTELLSQSSKKRKIAILPDDGSFGSRLLDDLKVYNQIKVFSWGYGPPRSDGEHLHILDWKTDLNGSEILIQYSSRKDTYKSKLVGRYNVENIAGMIALGYALQEKPSLIQKTLEQLPPVRGRLERVEVRSKGCIFVDYAHTPDALENVLMTLRPLTKGRLKVVFGCGGDRDRTKRPKMGAISELHADEIFVTSDNPRMENPDTIIEEIMTGFQKLKPIHVEADRRSAIAKSLVGLQDGDVVLIAGKGHEDYQILGTEKIHFDDREVVKSCF